MLTNSKVGTYTYPTQGTTSIRPHAPLTIAGQAVTYDANGNTLSYTLAGQTKTFTYDGENRPLSIALSGGATTTFVYGPDGERTRKANGTDVSWYLGNEAELVVSAALPAGQWTQYLHPDVRRVYGTITWLHKDHLGTNRVDHRHRRRAGAAHPLCRLWQARALPAHALSPGNKGRCRACERDPLRPPSGEALP